MADPKMEVIIELKDKLTAQLDKVKDSMGDLENRFAKATDASKNFALGVAAVGTAAGTLAYQALKAAGSAEQTKIAFETMLGSAQAADKFIKNLSDFAKTTPFELKNLETASKQLLAYGSSADDVFVQLRALGNITAGVGTDKLPQLILAFGQVQAATKLTGSELRQFSEAGVPLLATLATQFGTTAAAVQEMVSNGQVGFKDVEKAIIGMSSAGGKFDDLMTKQSKSLGGMVSNLADSWDLFLRGEGAKLIEWAKAAVSALNGFITNVLPGIIAGIAAFTAVLSENKAALIIVSGAIVGALVPAFVAMTAAAASAILALAPFMLSGAAVAAVIAGIYYLYQNWDKIVAAIRGIWDDFTNWIGSKIQAVADLFTGMWDGIVSGFNAFIDFIKNVFKTALAVELGLIMAFFDLFGIDIVQVFTNLYNGILMVLTTVGDFISTKLEEFKIFISSKMEAISGVFSKVLTSIKTIFTTIFTDIKTGVVWALSTLMEWVIGWTKPFIDVFSVVWDGITKGAQMAMDAVVNMIKAGFNKMIDLVNSLIQKINSAIQKGAGTLGVQVALIPEIPKLAKGGIVTGPTIAMVGEAGPEAVIPLNKDGGGFGGNVTVNINGGNYLSEDAAMLMADSVVQQLKLSNAVV